MGAYSSDTIALVITHPNSHPMQNQPTNQNDNNRPATNGAADEHGAASSESLVASEMSVGQGAVTGEEGTEENKEANPASMGQNPDRERLSGNRSN